ncbi:DUF4350 domain-containing protein [Neptuniibacter sp.]|uniref:DUF4350 domain-containing protein n=1 Tax=Neptuniibacter sp. TaxID=1962643 RepID=UPI00261031AC|nr:DUF4350 domain-containing protein [Neptuniibacter sp.]MCP4597238.1 DUF4350 domain-containing protein [Neptuniibacter sp.]
MNGNKGKILIVLLLCLLGFWLGKNMQQVERIVNDGPALSVTSNDFYAAGQLLKRSGQKVSHSSTMVTVDDLGPEDTLILTNTATLTREQDAETLLHWVRQGGNLIWEYSKGEQHNPLAEILSVTAISIEENYISETKQEIADLLNQQEQKLKESLTNTESTKKELTPKEAVRHNIQKTEKQTATSQISYLIIGSTTENYLLRFKNKRSVYHAALDSKNHQPDVYLLSQASTENTTTQNKTTLIQLAIGLGRVTVVSDSSLWNNRNIGLFDHAHSLKYLTSKSPHIFIQRNVNWPSVNQLILQYAPETALMTVLLLIFWLIYKGLRFGPIISERQNNRRSIKEHISAIANFHYRYDQHDFLLSSLRQSIYLKMRNNLSTFDRLTQSEQFVQISNLSQIQPEDVSFALTEAETYSDMELMRIIRLLITIRNAL